MHQKAAAGRKTIDVELTAIRIGDFVMVTFPGELTVQIGLNIKKLSQFEYTFVARLYQRLYLLNRLRINCRTWVVLRKIAIQILQSAGKRCMKTSSRKFSENIKATGNLSYYEKTLLVQHRSIYCVPLYMFVPSWMLTK